MTDTKSATTGPSRRQVGTNWDRMEALFQAAVDLYDYDLGWVPTRAEAAELIKIVGERHPGYNERSVTRIIGYFQDWQGHYPWVDPVTVRRAVDFHWDIWQTMTNREWLATTNALAVHPDPWEEEGFLTEKTESGDGTLYIPVTPRARRWRMLNDTDRRNLFTTIDRRRKKPRGQA